MTFSKMFSDQEVKKIANEILNANHFRNKASGLKEDLEIIANHLENDKKDTDGAKAIREYTSKCRDDLDGFLKILNQDMFLDAWDIRPIFAQVIARKAFAFGVKKSYAII